MCIIWKKYLKEHDMFAGTIFTTIEPAYYELIRFLMGACLHIVARLGHTTCLREMLKFRCEIPHTKGLLTNKYFERGIDVNGRDGLPNSLPPLMVASCCGHMKCIWCLLQYSDIDVNIVDDNGRTSLMWAARHNHVECVDLLLRHSADTSIRDKRKIFMNTKVCNDCGQNFCVI